MGEMRQLPAAERLLTPREVAAKLSLSVFERAAPGP
jgi:hypothetical protein